MSDATIVLRPVDEATLPALETLLAANGLPTRDVDSKPECFSLAYADDELVGAGGVEAYGPEGLLRSIVVEKSVRGNGYGAAICARLERMARADGVETLYLLTTTAADFFADRGYVEIDRSAVPGSIRETTEFTALCPATAVCTKRSL